MKLVIKLDNKYAEIFKADFYKNSHGIKSVMGEILLFDYLEALIPTGTNFHSHFTYFENGNYHFSIKYFDKEEKLYVDRKTFHNHIAVRKNTSPDFSKENEVSYEPRDKVLGDPLDMFMRGESSKPWSSRPLNHHISTFSMHGDGKYEDKFNWDENIQIGANDLVVDYRLYKDHTINLGAVLYDKGNPAFDIVGKPSFPHYLSKTVESDGLVIQFTMFTKFNKAEN